MKKFFLIVSILLLCLGLLSFIFSYLVTNSRKFTEIKIPGESEIELNNGTFEVYLINDKTAEANRKNYFFTIKDSLGNIISKFPDSLETKFLYSTQTIETNNKIYKSYDIFHINKKGKYKISSYTKNNNIKEIGILPLQKDINIAPAFLIITGIIFIIIALIFYGLLILYKRN